VNGLKRKVQSLFSFNPALLISILLAAQQGNCSDWASLSCINTPLQSVYYDFTVSDITSESNTFSTSTNVLYSWSSVVERDELLMLSSGANVIIAIIDSGIDTGNLMFDQALWQNSSESNDGVDNDKNGYSDDINGWNFGDGNKLIADRNGHGTNVAGIILNSAPQVRLMVLKINSGDSTTFYADAVVEALYYAVMAGADVINMSLSLENGSKEVQEAIEYAIRRGVMVVSSAGNSSGSVTFPGTVKEVITVGATTADGRALLWNSPTGSTIDITAPGKLVKTVGLGGETVFVTGTSFSAPMVSGAIAALIGMNPDLKPSTIENLIFNNARDLGVCGRDDAFGWGILSGMGIRKAATPAIIATKSSCALKERSSSTTDSAHSTTDSSYSTINSISSTADSFEISCYLPPTDSYTDVYIALVRNSDKETDKSDEESIWWLDSNGLWRGNNSSGIQSIAALRLDNNGVKALLFGDCGGIWRSFSPSGFEPGSYNLGIAVIGWRGLLAPLFWSQITF